MGKIIDGIDDRLVLLQLEKRLGRKIVLAELNEKNQEKDRDFDRQIDAALLEGIEAGQSFNEFHGKTAAPFSLEERYEKLQKQYKAKHPQPERISTDDPFMKGWNFEK